MTTIHTQLDVLRHKVQFLAILVFALVAVLFWILVSIFSTRQSSIISSELTTLARPLSPTINVAVLNTIEEKRTFTPAELAQFPIYIIPQDETGTSFAVTTQPVAGDNLAGESNLDQLIVPSSSPSATPEPDQTTPLDNQPLTSPDTNQGDLSTTN